VEIEVDTMSAILNLIFFSEKRKKILTLLAEGPKEIEEIKNKLKGNPCAIMPQIKKLKDMDLITQQETTYELSDIGEVIVARMLPLTNLLQAFEGNKNYWSKHDRRPIPSHLMNKINMLGKCILDEPELDQLFEFPANLKEPLLRTSRLRSFYSFFCPDCPKMQAACAMNGAEIDLILDKKIYNRLKEDFKPEYKTILEKGVSIYLYSGEIKPSSFVITDEFMFLKLFEKNGDFDHRRLISFNKSALEWGNELADYYIEHSKQVN